MFNIKLLAAVALLSSALVASGEVEAANGSYTALPQTTQQAKIKETVYAISGTTDTQLPPLDVPVNAAVELLARMPTSSSVVVTPTGVFVSRTVPNNPSATVPGARALRATSTAADWATVEDKATFPRVGATVDVSDSGALWELYFKVREPIRDK